MFTGIVEAIGSVIEANQVDGNLHLTVRSSVSSQLKIDQSVSHNGVCLTVVKQKDDWHKVQVIDESLRKSNLGLIKIGDNINP